MFFGLLCEVLFSFPLRYLSAIGYHALIFSLGWTAPPAFSQHFQASLLAVRGLADQASQVECNALRPGESSRVLLAQPLRPRPLTTSPDPAEARQDSVLGRSLFARSY